MIVAGIDIGHLNIKTVILKESEWVAGSRTNSAGAGESEGRDALDETARKCGASIEKIDYIVSTGSGVEPVPFAQKHKSLTSCLVKGAKSNFPSVRTLIDIGAETFTIIKMNTKGRALNFIGNDTCAAGTGVFLDTMAKAMRVSIEEMGPLSLEADKIAPISNMCAVFAESEVVSLVHKGTSRRNIIAGLHKAIAERIIATAKRIGIKEDIVLTGGVSNNIGCVKELEKGLGLAVHIPEGPETTAAYGAALMAEKLAS
ncbi:MAG: 2-hydroxyglutaryl-CoA dehydratase [bacterium]|nr:2-hydroxyglutaryl-CoA dehydratase [bacterium]